MSSPIRLKRAGRAGTALALGFVFAAVPVAAQAATVNLGTVTPFVVLGGQSVTNSGPSVLYGELGVSPGTSLTGFAPPGVVNGATHNNDAVAGTAQDDLTTAYNVAALEPVLSGDDLSGQDLGGQTLTAGAYEYTSSAQLTGTLTLDAENDPSAQFVIKVGSQLTTGSASRVEMARGANPCNVFWKVDTAVLGSTTAFQGNLMALTSISLGNGANVIGRLLAQTGSVSLINNVLDGRLCGSRSTVPIPGDDEDDDDGTPIPGGSPTGGTPNYGAWWQRLTGAPGGPHASTSTLPTRKGTATLRRKTHQACTDGFRATVRGKLIKRVVFKLDGKRISSATRSPFKVFVRGLPGKHKVTAHVTFKDATRAKRLTLGYKACSAVALRPRSGPSQFTG